MEKLNKNIAGFIIGSIGGGLHLLWSITVSLGLGQAFLDWIFWLHFIDNPFIITGFSSVRMIYLVLINFTIWYIIGWVFCGLWNRLNLKKPGRLHHNLS